MRYRLRTLLAQFTIRDLLWVILLAAVVSLGYRDRRAMMAQRAVERAELESEKAKYRQLSEQIIQSMTRISDIQARLDELAKTTLPRNKLREWRPASDDGRLDPSFPIYYPQTEQ